VSAAIIGALRRNADEWAEGGAVGRWFIAVMGSAATKETRFSSDVDLVFGYADAKGGDVEPAFVELLRRLEGALAPITVDCRLRPEGKSAQLAWEGDAYRNYLRTRARVWELQAHCKIEFVAGDRQCFDKVIDAVAERIVALDKEKTRVELSELRKKTEARPLGVGAARLNLRKGVGGLADAEIVAHLALLDDPDRYRELRAVPLETILTEAPGDYDDAARAVATLKAIDLHNERLFNASGSRLPTDERRLEEIAEAVSAGSAEELRRTINDAMKTIRELRKREFAG
jgi:glutamate-ammonia-ligase adenylyltransferase